MLRGSGASKIYSIEIREFRLKYAKKIGASFYYNASVTPTDEIIVDILSKETYGVDVAINVGYGVSFPEFINFTRKGGKVLLFGVNSQATQTIKQYDITTRGLLVSSDWIFNYVSPFSAAFKLFQEKIVNTDLFITRRLDLKDRMKALKT